MDCHIEHYYDLNSTSIFNWKLANEDLEQQPPAAAQAQQQQLCIIKRRHLELHGIIGNGVFGKVYKGILKTRMPTMLNSNENVQVSTNTNNEQQSQRQQITVAIKIPNKTISTTKYIRNRTRNEVLYEIQIISKLCHPNLVKFIGMVENQTCAKLPWLIMEFMSLGNLQSYLKSNSNVSYQQDFPLNCTLQIALGMNYIHSQNIVHGDLHLQNCLLSTINGNNLEESSASAALDDHKNILVKISDFGQSFVIVNEEDVLQGSIGKYGRPNSKPIPNELIYGARWKAPEIIPGPNYSSISSRPGDIWSYGILLYELWTSTIPFECLSDTQVLKAIVAKKDPFDFITVPISTKFPVHISVLMMDCWNFSPNSRPTFKRILQILNES